MGITTIYDSVVHGSFQLIKSLTNASCGSAPEERAWVGRYLETRRQWLANQPNLLLRKCVYRVEELKRLTGSDNWSLTLPIRVCGIQIDEQAFSEAAVAVTVASTPARASACDPHEPLLTLRTPYQTGSAVEFLQHALVKAKVMPEAAVDGVFGPLTAMLVMAYQEQGSLVADGVVGPATWSRIRELMQAT